MKHFIYFILCFSTRRIFCFIHNSEPNGIDWYLFFIFLFTHQTCVALSETAYLVGRFIPFSTTDLCSINTKRFISHSPRSIQPQLLFNCIPHWNKFLLSMNNTCYAVRNTNSLWCFGVISRVAITSWVCLTKYLQWINPVKAKSTHLLILINLKCCINYTSMIYLHQPGTLSIFKKLSPLWISNYVVEIF